MTRSRRRQALTLVTIIAVVVMVAQVGGVGASKPGAASKAKRAAGTRLVTVAGGAAPDLTSTSLAQASTKANEGETIRLHSTARVTTASRGTTQVVCGVVYGRKGDPSWTLGTPTETLTLKHVAARGRVTIDRTIAVPATDTYTASTRCHVATPARGGVAKAVGAISIAHGLPEGAAKPVE
jgi:hypothetical protein